MRDEATSELLQRGRTALWLGTVALVLSTALYYFLGCLVGMNARHEKSLFSLEDDRWQWSECLYASAITVTTVGYGDVLGTDLCRVWVDEAGRRRWESSTDGHEDAGFDASTARLEADWSPLTRAVTGVQVIVGMAFFLYVVAQLTSFFSEGGHGRLVSDLRAKRRLSRLRDHVVVCGLGDAAKVAVDELRNAGVPCAAIDLDPEVARAYRRERLAAGTVVGDATSQEALYEAHVERARALLALMPDDALNLVSVFTARGMTDDLHVVARGMRTWSAERLTTAGADTVIGIESLAGLRAASELIRPTVVGFLDHVMRDGGEVHFEAVRPKLSGGTVRLSDLALPEKAGLHAVAVRRAGSDVSIYNPAGSTELSDGDELLVFGTADQLARACDALHSGPGVSAPPPDDAPMEIGIDHDALPPRPVECHLRDHFVICGGGLVGMPIVRELLASERRFVLVDPLPQRCAELGVELPDSHVVRGDALDPKVLREAGVEHARGLVTALPSDRDNLVVAVSAGQLREGLRMVAVTRERAACERLERAGARVVAMGEIAGRRIAADVLRPHATTFLDRMRHTPGTYRVEGVRVRPASAAVGRTLAELTVYESTGMRVLAARADGRVDYVVNPGGEHRLTADMVLVVIGTPEQVHALERLVDGFA